MYLIPLNESKSYAMCGMVSVRGQLHLSVISSEVKKLQLVASLRFLSPGVVTDSVSFFISKNDEFLVLVIVNAPTLSAFPGNRLFL